MLMWTQRQGFVCLLACSFRIGNRIYSSLYVLCNGINFHRCTYMRYSLLCVYLWLRAMCVHSNGFVWVCFLCVVPTQGIWDIHVYYNIYLKIFFFIFLLCMKFGFSFGMNGWESVRVYLMLIYWWWWWGFSFFVLLVGVSKHCTDRGV